jgi:DNA-binding transcriptional ArsR family regulator
MGIIRKEIHPDELNHIADQLRVLGHPARLAILQHIAAQSGCICTDLSRDIGLAQATVSQHLRVLKDAGIIKGNVDGNSICYCIDDEALRQLRGDFLELVGGLDTGADKQC